MIPDAEVLRAAREFVERHGKHALAVARERFGEFKRAHDLVAVDKALRVLTACVARWKGYARADASAGNCCGRLIARF